MPLLTKVTFKVVSLPAKKKKLIKDTFAQIPS